MQEPEATIIMARTISNMEITMPAIASPLPEPHSSAFLRPTILKIRPSSGMKNESTKPAMAKPLVLEPVLLSDPEAAGIFLPVATPQ